MLKSIGQSRLVCLWHLNTKLPSSKKSIPVQLGDMSSAVQIFVADMSVCIVAPKSEQDAL